MGFVRSKMYKLTNNCQQKILKTNFKLLIRIWEESILERNKIILLHHDESKFLCIMCVYLIKTFFKRVKNVVRANSRWFRDKYWWTGKNSVDSLSFFFIFIILIIIFLFANIFQFIVFTLYINKNCFYYRKLKLNCTTFRNHVFYFT